MARQPRTVFDKPVTLIARQDELDRVCDDLVRETSIAIDTEFMRERTYYPTLCLIQLATPNAIFLVDALADGLDLNRLFSVLASPSITKVFHAGRQDLEIFWHRTGAVPLPIFDTQVAAMVCGFGESVSYEKLALALTGFRLEKSARLADWSRRPLGEREIRYAAGDVAPLRRIHRILHERLAAAGRTGWVEEELAVLRDPATYRQDPDEAWRRLKIRSGKPDFLARAKALTAWREREARRRNIPRNWLLRDDGLLDIAAQAPASEAALARCRTMNAQNAAGAAGKAILAALAAAASLPDDQRPTLPRRPAPARGKGPIIDLLRVLLRLKAEEHGVAARLLASAEDLEAIAADDGADVPALRGWRRTLFGEDALAVKHGRLGFRIDGGSLRVFPIGCGE